MGLLSTGSVAKYNEILAVSHNCALVQMIEDKKLKFEVAAGKSVVLQVDFLNMQKSTKDSPTLL